MASDRIPRIAAPLLFSAAILLSFRLEKREQPIEIAGAEPTPRSVAEVLAAYQSALAPGSPGYTQGSRSASVIVLELSDFGCPYCGKFAREVYPTLASEFVETGKVRWKQIPFELGMFENDGEATRTAECAARQGIEQFNRIHDRLFRGQDDWKSALDAPATLRAYAQAARLDLARFDRCFASADARERVRAASRLAEELAVNSTPTFFVNGRRIDGALPLQEFRRVLQQAIQESEAK